MNKYTPDNSAIIDATGKPWPVETPHLLPLPEGIDEFAHEDNSAESYILFSNHETKWGARDGLDTHWLARRPLPPVPKVKTQEELDSEWICNQVETFAHDRRTSGQLLREAIAYARQCPAKPAA